MKDSRREYIGAIETCRREIDVWYYLYAKRSLDQGWYYELSCGRETRSVEWRPRAAQKSVTRKVG
jgi:hypothetical protein